MNRYDDITGFVSVEELEEVSTEGQGAGTPAIITIVTLITKATVSVATVAVCETGACTSYCK
ncbi:hypothetical protein JHL18_24315 [Clostridium sp. YIM B02505]|uniref:Lantibiotic n=1 Tax=Clostridium yunnanense TaxID=2800325 RepID=A0ABS1EWI5_9CLOT|nr:hypothetical protein [Clostridium yunnanense]MBK1813747.1 hypothetical protein [Clostridium yunnanense]